MKAGLSRLLRGERGVVAPLVALMLVAFIGMAALTIDVGRLYAQRADLQHSMDAAAVAGGAAFGKELIKEGSTLESAKSKAIAAAEGVAAANGDPSAKVTVSETATAYDARIWAQGTRPTSMKLASVLGIMSVDVGAVSTARAWQSKGVKGAGNLIPLGLDVDFATEDKIDTEVVIKIGVMNNEKGNYYCIDFDPPQGGANEFEDRLKNGYQGEILIGDTDIGTETGNMKEKTRKGLEGRVGTIVLVPIVSFAEVGGFTYLELLGFASILITEVNVSGNEAQVTGTYLGPVSNYGVEEPVETGGVWTWKLVKN